MVKGTISKPAVGFHPADAALQASEERFRLLVDDVKDYAIIMLDAQGRVVTWNEGAQRLKGYTQAEIVGQSMQRFYSAEAVAAGTPARLLALATAEGRCEDEGWRVRKDGTRFFADVVLTAIRDASGELIGFAKITRDISERKTMELALFEEKERAQVTLNSIGEAVACTDINGNISFPNRVAETMTGWSHQEAIGRPMAQVLRFRGATNHSDAPNREKMTASSIKSTLLSSRVLVSRDGLEIPVEDSVAPICDREGLENGAVFVFRDVSAARAMSLQMLHMAGHDALTGLPNRVLLNDRIWQAIASARRLKKTFAILFLDLDGFKHINDSLGHGVGDKLLKSIAKRLVSCVRGSDTVSRQGGDEFVVLLGEMEEPGDAAVTAKRIVDAVSGPHRIDQRALYLHAAVAAGRMLDAVAEPHSVERHELHVTASVGLSVYPGDGEDAETLIKNADTAMYQAKEGGRQGYRFFEPEMNVRAIERQFIEEGLRGALERREFLLHYQPILDLTSGAIIGAEALIRWMHPTRGAIPPSQFIPIAEDCGLIVRIGAWVLHEACTQARAWADSGLPAITMAVNASAIELRKEGFLDRLFATLKKTGMAPTSLVMELTESVLMQDAELAASVLQTLRERGVKIAIDDFGTGYSSLGYLRRFPLDTLKIDQSVVDQISLAEEDRAIVTAVIGMARGLKLRVIAEGVQTLQEIALLLSLCCDAAQGYYFSHPVPPEQFARLLRTGVPGPWRTGVLLASGLCGSQAPAACVPEVGHG